MPSPAQTRDEWSAAQYLKFRNQRTHAAFDLVGQLPLFSPARVIDLGCGPGNSTEVLASRFPDADISGVDSSSDMLDRARRTLPRIRFVQADVRTYDLAPGPGVDLLFSNAVFHWMRRGERVRTIIRLLKTQTAGNVFAFQMPDYHEEPSHRAMREIAAAEGSWRKYFQGLDAEDRPELDPIESPAEYYNMLIPYCDRVDVWHTCYQHVMNGPRDIVEWVKGSGLQPFLNALPEGVVRNDYLQAYEKRLEEVYSRLADGKIMLRYPRLFVVAVRK